MFGKYSLQTYLFTGKMKNEKQTQKKSIYKTKSSGYNLQTEQKVL